MLSGASVGLAGCSLRAAERTNPVTSAPCGFHNTFSFTALAQKEEDTQFPSQKRKLHLLQRRLQQSKGDLSLRAAPCSHACTGISQPVSASWWGGAGNEAPTDKAPTGSRSEGCPQASTDCGVSRSNRVACSPWLPVYSPLKIPESASDTA